VAQIFGVDQIDDTCFLVLELVEGEGLDERLARGPLPVKEAIDVARQIADGLEAAHEAGVIHRDLKPANVRVTHDGRVKLLDFGLAKTADAKGESGSTTDSVLTTQAGRLLGTPTYMAPEQARGKPIDRRVDLWALGCVFYECLTGRRAFDGESISDVLAAVLEKEPDLDELPRATPAHVRDLIARCLVKDPRERMRDAGDARLELAAGPRTAFELTAVRPGRTGKALAFAAGLVLAAGALWTWNRPQPAESRPVTRFSLAGTGMSLDAFQGLALSPDGRQLIYRARGEHGSKSLHLRNFDSLETVALPGRGGWLPSFSPDGRRAVYFAVGDLNVIHLGTQVVRTICFTPSGYSGATWLSDEEIVFCGASSPTLFRVGLDGGPHEPLEYSNPPPDLVSTPSALPGGEAILCTARMKPGGLFDVALYSMKDREIRVLAANGFTPVYSPTGHILYQQGGDGPLMAVRFDLEQLETRGSPFPVLYGIGDRVSYQARMFDISQNGTLAYVPQTMVAAGGDLVWVDREGGVTSITEFDTLVDTPRLSHDGTRLAFRTPAPECDIWVHDIARGVTTRVTHEEDNHGVAWSPDDERLYFNRAMDGAWALASTRSDGAGEVELHTEATTTRGFASSVSHDGRFALVGASNEETLSDIMLVALDDGEVTPFLASRFNEKAGTFSPDGTHVAYVSDESGAFEVYIESFPERSSRVQVSTGGGDEPVWAPAGGQLFFREGWKLFSVDVTTSPSLEVGRSELLFESRDGARGTSGLPDFDVDASGERFVVIRSPTSEGAAINVVLDWFQEIEAAETE
jgi:Tol biopolymer transport system component